MKKPLSWQIATVTKIKVETPRTKSFTLALPDWMQHRAGQHYDVRLTAEDGYQAQRSYSIASEPERLGEVELTVERIADGEVSGYMHDVLIEGDKIEVRGPIGVAGGRRLGHRAADVDDQAPAGSEVRRPDAAALQLPQLR